MSEISGFKDHLKRMYILESLIYSEGGRTPSEIAEISIYSVPEIKETCKNLLEEDVVGRSNNNKYHSTDRTRLEIDDDIFERIKNSYETYLEKFGEADMFSAKEGGSEITSYPLKSSIATEPEGMYANYFTNVSLGIEENHFLTKKNTLPAITDLSLRNLERFPILLIKLLWVQVSDENKEYWRFTYIVFTDLYESPGSELRLTQMVIEFLFNLALCPESQIPRPQSNQSINSNRHHILNILSNSKHLATFVAYPALESYIKHRCKDDIEMDGTVKNNNTVRNFSPYNDRDYYQKGNRCSSLRDLLIHFENEVADDNLKEQLVQMRKEIGKLAEYPESKIYGLIYQWRNSASHEASPDVKYGIILNMICMLIWNELNNQQNE